MFCRFTLAVKPKHEWRTTFNKFVLGPLQYTGQRDSITQAVEDVGKIGHSDKGQMYLPLQSKESIVEYYYLTVFALSEELEFAKEIAPRRDLIKAIADKTLAEGTLKFHFNHGADRSKDHQ